MLLVFRVGLLGVCVCVYFGACGGVAVLVCGWRFEVWLGWRFGLGWVTCAVGFLVGLV